MSFDESELVQRIRGRFCMPEYATIANVQGDQGKFADAIAVNLWRSRGYAVVGFEVKSARSDWLRELKQPEKAEACAAYCHTFFIVANEGVVKDGELPLGWGLMEPHGEFLRIKANAKTNEHRKELTRSFMVNLIRRASEKGENAKELAAVRGEGWRAGLDEGIRRSESREDKSARQRLDIFEKMHAEFKERTGIEISGWDGGKQLVATYKLSQRIERIPISLRYVADTLKREVKDIEGLLKGLAEVTGETKI